jgi:hypothetical protein
MCILNVVQI